ncbi:hypothetical protein WME88_27425 [Sorangium sp. So ce216]
MIVPRLIVGAAVVLAVLLARREPAHRPLAVALGGVLAGDLVRAALELPSRVELALYLAAPALSAWCAIRVLAGYPLGKSLEAPVLLLWAPAMTLAIVEPELWSHVPVLAHAVALFLQGGAALLFWRSPRAARTPETCALVLAAGDVVALAGPLGFPRVWADLGYGWAVAAAQAGVMGAVLVVLQLRQLLTPAAGTRSGGERG